MAREQDQRPETLEELFDQNSIKLNDIPRPNKQHGGPRSKLLCPACGGGREREKNFWVKIDPDGQGATWHCFRANSCGLSGGGRLAGSSRQHQQVMPKVYRRPSPPASVDRPPKFIAYFAAFGISQQTVEAFGVYRIERGMPDLDADGRQTDRWITMGVLAYPYRYEGGLTNVKYKAIYPGGKKRFVQEKDAEPTLYNLDNFTDDTMGLIAEGEDDVLALWECGYRQVTTLPNGSPSKLAEVYDPATDTDERYMPLRGEPRIDRLKKIILAGDMDEAGARHHEEIARRVGKARCWLVRWPEGCKDAKETLTKRGRDAVRFAIGNAAPYPLEGVEFIQDEMIHDLYSGVQAARYVTGYAMIDQRVSLSAAGQFIVTTGVPGHGKSAFWNATAMLYVERNEEEMRTDVSRRPFHVVIVSAEMKPGRVMADLISQRAGKPFFPNKVLERVPFGEAVNDHAPWIRKHFTFIRWKDRSTQPPMSWLRNRVTECVTRTGAQLVILDPWQEFDDELPDNWRRPHSAWVGLQLQRWIGLASDLLTNVVLIVHPVKLRRDRDGKFPIPEGYDIADSQGFYSRPDVGLTVHRPNKDTSDMLIRTWKTKDTRFGSWGDTTMRFDPSTTRVWPMPVDADALDPPAQHWQETSG